MSDMKWFQPPVLVKTSKNAGLIYEVSSVQAAMDRLREWDRRTSLTWRKAFEVCVAALEDKATPDEARLAFEKAARATGNLIKR